MSRPLLALVLLTTSCADKPMNASEFTEEFAKQFRAALPSLSVTVEDDLHLKVRREDGGESNSFLDNAYRSYLQDPGACNEVIQGYVQSIVEIGDMDAPVDRTRIVPVIKDRNYTAEVAASLRASGEETALEHVFEELNEDLVIVYAVDHPRGIRYLTPADLGEAGLQRSELRALAVENLRRILPELRFEEGSSFSILAADGYYETSLLLLTDIWSGGSIRVDGEIVVAVPSRGVLLVTGSKNADGIAKLRELVTQDLQESPYRITDRLFVFRDGGFTRFEPTQGR